MAPSLRDVTEERAPPDTRAVPHRGHDVPVRVLSLALHLDDGDVLAVDRDAPALDGVDGSPVERGDVDPEMEGLAAAAPDPRIPQQAANGVLPVERLDRPAMRPSA